MIKESYEEAKLDIKQVINQTGKEKLGILIQID